MKVETIKIKKCHPSKIEIIDLKRELRTFNAIKEHIYLIEDGF